MEGQIDKNEKDNTWVIVGVCIAALILIVVLLKKNEHPTPRPVVVFGNFQSVLVDTQRGYEYHKDVNTNVCFLTTKSGTPMKVSCEEIKYYFSDKLLGVVQKNVQMTQKRAIELGLDVDMAD
jgi:hypothetical protein